MSLRYSEISDEDIDTVSAMAERYLTHGDYVTREASRRNYYGVKAKDGGKIPALHLPPDDGLRIVYEERFQRFYRDLPRFGMTCPICGGERQCGALIRLFSLN